MWWKRYKKSIAKTLAVTKPSGVPHQANAETLHANSAAPLHRDKR